MKGSEMLDKYLDLSREWKKLWNMKVTVLAIVNGAPGTVTEGLVQGLGNKKTSGYHPNYSIIEIGRNIEKSPEDLRRPAVTQTPV